MSSWWTTLESVAALSNLMLTATLVFAALTVVLVYLAAGKTKDRTNRLYEDLETSRKQIKSLERAAAEIRKELLETQQHQDISQLRLKTSTVSAEELRQELVNARKRLEIAEAAIKAHEAQATARSPEPVKGNDGSLEAIENLELELEPEVGLTESQREQLINLLDPGPKGSVDIFCVLGDEGSEQTARQIEQILAADGWRTNGVTQSAFSKPPQGIVLAVNGKETAPSYSSFLQRVFSTIGIKVSAKVESKYREWSLTVIVGTVEG